MPLEIFNALHVAKRLQSAGSRMTYVAIIALDEFESVMAFRDIRSQSNQLSYQI